MEFGISNPASNNRTRIYSFGGLNRTRKGGRHEFADMYNMSANEYPCLAPQGGRQIIKSVSSSISAVVAPDPSVTSSVQGITGVYGYGFYYNGECKSTDYKLAFDWRWQIEQKGNLYIINGYDKTNNKSKIFYYNIDTDEFAEGGTVMNDLILSSGSSYVSTIYTDAYGVYNYSVTTADDTVISNKDFFKRYKAYTQTANGGDTTMSESVNIFEQYFKIGDELTIEGFAGADNNGQIWNIQSQEIVAQPNVAADRNNTIDADTLSSDVSLGSMDIVRVVVTGFSINTEFNGRHSHRMNVKAYNIDGETVDLVNMVSNNNFCSGVTIRKRTRVFDNITVHQGRIWGSVPSGNQLYASPSDDIFSFSAEDIENKYGARIPSDMGGPFTALCSFNNDLIAFKSDSITVVSGNNPYNYTASVINGIGCISPRSVAVTPGGVIFLSYGGFYIYNGSTPRCISTKLNKKYRLAVSGFDGTSYYASALSPEMVMEMLVYNTQYGIWYKEDDVKATGYFRFGRDFYLTDDFNLYKMDATKPDEWSFVFTRAFDDSLDNKGINEIWVRAEISDGAEFCIATAADDGEFVVHSTFDEVGLMVYRCPVRLNVRDSYQIKVSGSGKVVFYEFEIRKAHDGRRYKER